MVSSRYPKKLLPVVYQKYLMHRKLIDAEFKGKNSGISVICVSTYRDAEAQHEAYKIGRDIPGRKVTNADWDLSFHSWRCAYDLLILAHGKVLANGDHPYYYKIGELGESVGLNWAGRWVGDLKESAHFQYTNGLTIKDLRAGKQIT